MQMMYAIIGKTFGCIIYVNVLTNKQQSCMDSMDGWIKCNISNRKSWIFYRFDFDWRTIFYKHRSIGGAIGKVIGQQKRKARKIKRITIKSDDIFILQCKGQINSDNNNKEEKK
eukprot:552852_1